MRKACVLLLFFCLMLLAITRPCRAAPNAPWDTGRVDPGLRVRAGLRTRVDARQELFAMVTVSLPFEPLAAPVMPTEVIAADEAQESGTADGAAPSPPVRGSPPPSPAPSPESSPPPSSAASLPRSDVPLELTPRLARIAVRVALRVAGLPRSLARLEALRSRAHAAAWLPDLRLRGGRTADESLRWTPTDEDPYRYTQAGGTRLLVELELSWRLGHLLYTDSEPRIEELLRLRARTEREVVEAVLAALFEWQKARLRCLAPSALPDENAESCVAMIRAAATLDVLTDGWFVRYLPRAANPF
jgi:hypothetical protein